jgi:putative intracellular protease/amidase
MGKDCCGITRRNYLVGSAGAIVAATGIGSVGLIASTAKAEPAPVPNAQKYRCPPCGCASDQLVFDKPGSCPSCGMTLIPMDEHGVTKVAVLMFDGAEIIDFAGPWEVFGTAGFAVHSVAAKVEPLMMVFGQKLTPDYTFETSPRADILLVPGGAVFQHLDDKRTIGWIQAQAQQVDHVVSVCTGAYFLQKAGLLAGQTVTATNGMIEDFAAPETKVVYDRRYVDNGKILTTAGLSSGIDGAIHLVSRLRGLGFAQAVALEMEYPWDPDSKWARAELADQYLPSKLLSRRGEVDGAKFGILSTQGGTDRWEARLLFSPPTTDAEVAALLRKLIAANKAQGGMFKPTSHIPTVPMFDAAASNSQLSWRFTDDRGRAWKGVASIVPGPEPRSGIVATLKLSRAS